MKLVALCGGPQVPRSAATTPQAHATQQQQDDTAHQMSPLGLVGPGSFSLLTPPRCVSTRTCVNPPRAQSLQRTASGQAEDAQLGLPIPPSALPILPGPADAVKVLVAVPQLQQLGYGVVSWPTS